MRNRELPRSVTVTFLSISGGLFADTDPYKKPKSRGTRKGKNSWEFPRLHFVYPHEDEVLNDDEAIDQACYLAA